jgi:predicted transcriptional regulator
MSVKVRLSVYLDPELMDTLAAYADRRERSRSLIAEAAIASFLSPDADEAREAAVTKRIDQLDRRMNRLLAVERTTTTRDRTCAFTQTRRRPLRCFHGRPRSPARERPKGSPRDCRGHNRWH